MKWIVEFEVVRQVSDTLRSGGWFVVGNPHDRVREDTTVTGTPRNPPTPHRLPPDEAASAVVAEGDLERRIELPPYYYALCFEGYGSPGRVGLVSARCEFGLTVGVSVGSQSSLVPTVLELSHNTI